MNEEPLVTPLALDSAIVVLRYSNLQLDNELGLFKALSDTNILLYSISRDPAETRKRAISIELLERDD